VIGGLLPEAALAITRAARTGDTAQAIEASDRLGGLWELFETYGSLRVVATAARADPHDPHITEMTAGNVQHTEQRRRTMRAVTPPRSGARMQRSVAASLAAILELDSGDVPVPDERHPEPWTVWTQWLAQRGLGLVPIAEPKRFKWPGPWLAVLTAPDEHDDVGAVAFGRPPGIA
jgi:hypothetical protein